MENIEKNINLENASYEHFLEVRDLKTSFFVPAGEVKSVDGTSFNVDKGKILGIVGESGSGKSVTAYSIMQILSAPGKIVGGSIKLEGKELVGLPEKELAKIRGGKMSIIFQDPMTSLNPVYSIGNQLREAIYLHRTLPKTDKDGKQVLDKREGTKAVVADIMQMHKNYTFVTCASNSTKEKPFFCRLRIVLIQITPYNKSII